MRELRSFSSPIGSVASSVQRLKVVDLREIVVAYDVELGLSIGTQIVDLNNHAAKVLWVVIRVVRVHLVRWALPRSDFLFLWQWAFLEVLMTFPMMCLNIDQTAVGCCWKIHNSRGNLLWPLELILLFIGAGVSIDKERGMTTGGWSLGYSRISKVPYFIEVPAGLSSLIPEEILLGDIPAHVSLGWMLAGWICIFMTCPHLFLRLLLIFKVNINMVPEFDTPPDKLSACISWL